MELKDLFQFILILVLTGILMGVGALVFINLFSTGQIETTITNEQITADPNVSAILANVPFLSVSSIYNVTNASHLVENFTTENSSYVIVQDPIFNQTTVNVTYSYRRNTSASTMISQMNVSLLPIANTWIPLIVTVLALAIVLALVIRSFARRR